MSRRGAQNITATKTIKANRTTETTTITATTTTTGVDLCVVEGLVLPDAVGQVAHALLHAVERLPDLPGHGCGPRSLLQLRDALPDLRHRVPHLCRASTAKKHGGKIVERSAYRRIRMYLPPTPDVACKRT